VEKERKKGGYTYTQVAIFNTSLLQNWQLLATRQQEQQKKKKKKERTHKKETLQTSPITTMMHSD
jgi:hypothetical protein